jgi:hypothetical protein
MLICLFFYLFICILVYGICNEGISSSEYIALNAKVIGEKLIEKHVEAIGCDIFSGTILTYACKI